MKNICLYVPKIEDYWYEVLCNEARKNGIKELYDNFEIDRGNTLDIFKEVGFEIVEKQTWKKFDKDVNGVLVKIDL